MKDIKDYTLNELAEIEKEYQEDFSQMLSQFFDAHPLVEHVHLTRSNSLVGNYISIYPVDRIQIDIDLKGVKYKV